MLKILIIALVVITIIGILIWVFWFPKSKKISSNPIGDTLGEVSNTYQNSVNDIKNNLEETSKKTVSDAKETLYDKAQAVLSSVFDKHEKNETPSQPVNVTVVNETNKSAGNNFYEIDLSKNDSLKLKLAKNTKYQLSFKNIPSSFCLYIEDKKYELAESKILEIQFNSQGKYTLKTNSCNLAEKNIGEITID